MRYSLSQYEHRGEDWKTFRIAALLCVVALLSMLIVEQAWSAQPPGLHLNITEVSVDLDAGKITIMGEDLDFGGALDVTLGDFGFLSVDSADANEIVANLPIGITDGDYLLTVSRGNGQSQNDEYDLTIGGVGPAGAGGFVIFSGGTLNALNTTLNSYMSMVHEKCNGGGDCNRTESSAQFSVPVAGTLTDLRVDLSNDPNPAPTDVGTYVFTVRLNGADTSLACTIPGDNAVTCPVPPPTICVTCTDTTSCVDIAMGDLIALESDPDGDPQPRGEGHYTIFTPGACCNGETNPPACTP